MGSRAGQDRCGKSRLPPVFDPRIVQPVANRYTDYATRHFYGTSITNIMETSPVSRAKFVVTRKYGCKPELQHGRPGVYCPMAGNLEATHIKPSSAADSVTDILWG